MSLGDYFRSRLQRTLEVLALPAGSDWVLSNLGRLDTNPETARQVQSSDIYNRAGILSWTSLAHAWSEHGGTLPELERAVTALSDWGLVQVVGQQSGDPVVPGSSAHRLTYAGRACLGLAPGPGAEPPPPGEAQPWLVLHGSSREALLLSASQRHEEAWKPLLAPSSLNELPALCGHVAVSLVTRGVAVVDAFDQQELEAQALLRELLLRTARARAPRLLLLREPAPLRTAVQASGARLEWVETLTETRRGNAVLDQRFTELLRRAGERLADVSGVPDSDIVSPKYPKTRFDELVLPRKVRWQFEQVMLHARYRLEVLPGQEHIPGKGQGYRLLLSGLPGTGKSIAAEALAHALGRPLVRLDLSSVLSKWLGETEKLLSQVFDVAEAMGAVLVLDEAEALFRQRDSGQSGTGALATGVAYLLTRLDRFAGVLVATTNRTRDLDEAFFRRFDDFVILPVPDEETRRVLWERMLGPEAEKVDLDLLARRFSVTGGLIRGAAIRAMAWARGLGRPLDTATVLASLSRELSKSDRATDQVMLQPYREQVKALLEGKFELLASPSAPPSRPD